MHYRCEKGKYNVSSYTETAQRKFIKPAIDITANARWNKAIMGVRSWDQRLAME
jgi:hypothetical protein